MKISTPNLIAARLVLLSLLAFPATAQTPDIAAAVERANLANKSGDFDGVIVLSQDAKVLAAKAYGYSDRSTKTLLRPDTVFRLASLTKQVTALLVMQEVAAGRMGLDRQAGQFLSKLPLSSARVTVRQLLQHVSGLPNPSEGPEDKVPAFYTHTDPDAADITKSALGFCSAAPKRDPGGGFEYNNCDYIVLGALLEAVTGKPYAQLVRERVIEPLGLKSWGMFPADPRRAPRTPHAYKTDGSEEDPQNPATYGSAGGLFGNALDVAKWNDAILTHRLLSAADTEIMFRADPKLYGEALGSWAYDLPLTAAPLHIIERQGDIGSTRLLNLLVQRKNASVVIIANTDRADLFNTYSKKGLGYEILKIWFGGH